MYRTFLSWRYLKARRTNIIGIVGIGVGVGALILILSIMTGFLEETKKTLRGGLADLIVEPSLALRRDGTSVPSTPSALLAEVRADPRVVAATAQLSWVGILSPSDSPTQAKAVFSDSQVGERAFVQLVGIDVATEFETSALRADLVRETLTGGFHVHDPDQPFAAPPEYHAEGRELARVLVGEQVAANWFLRRGDEIQILTAIPGSKSDDKVATNNRRYIVAGTFRSGENEMDGRRVFLEREELASFIGAAREYSQVLVKLKDYERDGSDVRAALGVTLYEKGLIAFSPDRLRGELQTWEDFRRPLLAAIENERVLMGIMLGLVLVVAGFTVFAILSMMVTEKRRDIGILTALGATPTGVLQLFLLIAFWDALLGALGGAAIGTVLALNIDDIEKWLSATFHIQIFNRNVYAFDHIPAVVNPVWVGCFVLLGFVSTLLFAAIPAWRAGRLHPLEALRYE